MLASGYSMVSTPFISVEQDTARMRPAAAAIQNSASLALNPIRALGHSSARAVGAFGIQPAAPSAFCNASSGI